MQSSMFQRIVQAQTDFQEELLAKRNVVGVAVGYKATAQGITDTPAIVVLVEQKLPVAALTSADEIPSEINGIRTDVLQVGRLEAQVTPKDRFRPMIPGGVSIGHYKITAGTLGVIVKDRDTGEPFILSNNHVLANSNEAMVGDPILQPGPTDGGQNPSDVVARLERFVGLHYTTGDVNPPGPTEPDKPNPTPNPTPTPTDPSQPGQAGCDVVDTLIGISNLLAGLSGSEKRVQATSAQAVAQTTGTSTATDSPTVTAQVIANSVDGALARPIDPTMFSSDILNIGTITGTKPASLGMQVRKMGRTTGFTTGSITLLNATVNVGYRTSLGSRTARFDGQIISTAMSQGGDSGSLIVDASEQKAVGLLFAGSASATIFTPIDKVMQALRFVF